MEPAEESADRRVLVLSQMLEALKALSMAQTPGVVMSVSAAAARMLAGADGGVFLLRQGDEILCTEDASEPLLAGWRGPASQSFFWHAGSGHVVDLRAAADAAGSMELAAGIRGLIAVPIRSRMSSGRLGVYWRSTAAPTDAAVALLQSLAESATISLSHLELDADLERRVAERTAALQEARETAEAASRAKSAFLANMSHELRTPLNAVMGYAQILQRDDTLGRTQRESAEAIHRSGEHLLTLINDILDLARIEADRLELHPEPFAWPPFLADVADLFRIRARQKGLSFTYQIGSALPEGVLADETRLRQVLLNLLGNAVKFTDSGGITFRVSVEDGLSCLEIADTGPGIALADQAVIFQPFRQLGSRLSRQGGTGLGLSITRRLVEMMGGSIRLESRPGRGSVFTVWLPLEAHRTPPRIPDPTEGAPIVGYEGPARRILIVDDQAANRAIIRMALEPLGFVVEEAVDGLDGLERAHVSRPDAIILDLVMPRMDGFEALRRMRADTALASITILVTSASAFATDQQRSEAGGATAFLPKPISLDALMGLLEEHLGLSWCRASAATTQPPEPPLRPRGDLSDKQADRLVMLARRGDIAALEEWVVGAREALPVLTGELQVLLADFDLEGVEALARQARGGADG